MIICLIGIPVSAWSGPVEVGTVLHAKGAVTAGPEGGDVRFLGKKMPLYEGDVLTTGKDGFVVIQMIDGARMTLRSNTVFALEKYAHGKGEESALLRMFRGGIRAVTGLIAKRNMKDGYRLHTTTAVVGVRGTEFDARLCENDCADEEKEGKQGETITKSPVIGRVARIKGSLTARAENNIVRSLAKGGPIYEKDILETGSDSFAILVFRDNSRLTLQSESRFIVEKYQYRDAEGDGAFFKLVRGGLRVLSGLVARRKPGALKVGTPTAVVGVRGTGFDIRLCEEGDCAGEDEPNSRVVGRVVLVKGRLTAFGPDGTARELKKSGSVFEGDTLETGSNDFAVLAFRDDSRVTLQSDSRFKVEQYRYQGDEGDGAFFRLFRGGLRVFTGLMTRKRPAAFKVGTPTAVVGVRGTGFDLLCRGNCGSNPKTSSSNTGFIRRLVNLFPQDVIAAPPREDGMFVFVWDGIIELKNKTGITTLNADQVAFLAHSGAKAVLLPAIPLFIRDNPMPRPDRVIIDKGLFSAVPGLYVNVWDGTVELKHDLGSMLIGKNQTAFVADGQTPPVLQRVIPVFMILNPALRPDKIIVDLENFFSAVTLDKTVPGLYVTVYEGHAFVETDAGVIDLGRWETALAVSQDQEPVRLEQLPFFQVEDMFPHPKDLKGTDSSVPGLNVDDPWAPGSQEGIECEIQ